MTIYLFITVHDYNLLSKLDISVLNVKFVHTILTHSNAIYNEQ